MGLKGKVYRMVVRLAVLYGSECWPLKKAQVQRLMVAKMRMIRWMCGYTRIDRIKNKSSKVVVGGPGIGHNAISDGQDQQDAQHLEDAEVARQLELRFGEMQSGIYAKLVEKCGDRLYWENWSKKVGLIAKKFIERISKLVTNVPELKQESLV